MGDRSRASILCERLAIDAFLFVGSRQLATNRIRLFADEGKTAVAQRDRVKGVRAMISQKQATGVVERQGVEERGGIEISRAALIGTAATILAVIFSMAMTAAFGDQYFDWLSFPFGALGFVACAIAAAADRRPKKLAYVMLCINMAYWVYFCVNLPGPAAAH